MLGKTAQPFPVLPSAQKPDLVLTSLPTPDRQVRHGAEDHALALSLLWLLPWKLTPQASAPPISRLDLWPHRWVPAGSWRVKCQPQQLIVLLRVVDELNSPEHPPLIFFLECTLFSVLCVIAVLASLVVLSNTQPPTKYKAEIIESISRFSHG